MRTPRCDVGLDPDLNMRFETVSLESAISSGGGGRSPPRPRAPAATARSPDPLTSAAAGREAAGREGEVGGERALREDGCGWERAGSE
jgi:hypothetical protein